MKGEVKFFKKEEVQKVQKEQPKVDYPLLNGYPTFNGVDHTLIDLSDLDSSDNDKWGSTISVKLPNGKFITFCVMTLTDEICVDTKFHGIEKEKTKVLGFDGNDSGKLEHKNLYAIIGKVD